MTRSLASLLLLLLVWVVPPARAQDLQVRVESGEQVLLGREASVQLRLLDDHAQALPDQEFRLTPRGRWSVFPDGTGRTLRTDAEGAVQLDPLVIESGSGGFELRLPDGRTVQGSVHAVHQLWVLVPPLLAILLALIFRQVILALAAGVWVGAWVLYGNPLSAFLRTLDQFIVGAVSDEFQATVVLFTASMGGMVGVIASSGGTQGVVDSVSRWIRGARSAQVVTWLMGILIFFDDYTNTLVVGNTMRPITDRMRVSREKLSYIVDSTAAPVTTIALVSTWVGYQVSLIREGLGDIGEDPNAAYGTFIASIPYSGYAWLALALVLLLAWTGRDFGPMLRAERRARGGAVLRDGAQPLMDEVASQLRPADASTPRAYRAIVPVSLLLLSCLVGLFWDGRVALLAERGPAGLEGLPLREFFAHADPARALFWGAMVGSISAVALAVAGRGLRLQRAVEAWVAGSKAMVTAIIILVLAWSIKDVCSQLGTGPVVVDWATGNLSPVFLPAITFVLAAFIAFSTGTSWAAMAIMMPIVIPLAHGLPEAADLSASHAQAVLLGSIASVLSGAVWGDHCSPISDTTIMSSMASGSDHVDHVRTQLPYALLAGGVSLLLCSLPAGLGWSPWLSLPVALLVLATVVRFVGKRVEGET